jgi:hypothetical protein
MKKPISSGTRDSSVSGQALIEYVLSLFSALAIAGAIGLGYRTVVLRLWKSLYRQVSAPCPRCVPNNPDQQFR